MAANGWEKKDDYWHKWEKGRHALVAQRVSGWDASVRYPSGETIRAPKYYASVTSAKAWADRELAR